MRRPDVDGEKHFHKKNSSSGQRRVTQCTWSSQINGYVQMVRIDTPICVVLKQLHKMISNTIQPGYNDIGLNDTSSIASDIVVPIN
jgi:hypothetical protein